MLVSSYGTQVDSAVQFKVTVVDPCLLYSPLPPVDQLYTVGDAALTLSLDPYLQNALCPFEETLSVSGSESQPGLVSIDQTMRQLKIESTDLAAVGTYTVVVTSTLNDPISSFSSALYFFLTVQLEPVQTNSAPAFATEFPSVIEIEKSQSSEAWTLPLPQITDLNEEDTVVASARLGVAGSFMDFSADQNDLSIADLSSEVVIEGLHENLSLTLDDSKD